MPLCTGLSNIEPIHMMCFKIIMYGIIMSLLVFVCIVMFNQGFESIQLHDIPTHTLVMHLHNPTSEKTNPDHEPYVSPFPVNFMGLSEWVKSHPNGPRFIFDPSESDIDFASIQLHKQVMDGWNDREMIKIFDQTQLIQIDNHCIRKWKHLIQNTLNEPYIGEYILKQGNKIGALRHFSFVPWDDDFDILMYIMSHKYQHVILELFEQIPAHPLYGKCSMVYRPCGFAKIYFNNLSQTMDVEGFGNMNPDVWSMEYTHLDTNEIRYPLIDVFFGYLDDTDDTKILYTKCNDITDTADKCVSTYVKDTFPVQYLPINDQYYPFEKNILFSMHQGIGEYDEGDPVQMCVVEIMGLYTHRKDTDWAYGDPVQCRLFWNDFTFVRIDQYVDASNINEVSWINVQSKQWLTQFKFINIKISFDKTNAFHRAYMMPMMHDNTFQIINLTQNITRYL
eukprot:243297_1